jgi:hypothetical protein
MDQVKYAASRLRRLQWWLAYGEGNPSFREDLRKPFSVLSLVTRPGALQLRKTIDDTVVAFVPPSLPLITPDLTCSHVLVEFVKNRWWRLTARIETLVRTPVIFVIGFVTNKHGYFGFLIGALNYDGPETDVSSSSSAATVTVYGVSQWIQDKYDTARGEGVTFRIHSSTDLHSSLRSLFQEWAATFDSELYRPFSLLDTDRYYNTPWAPSTGEGSVLDQPGEDPGLSFEVSLRFE